MEGTTGRIFTTMDLIRASDKVNKITEHINTSNNVHPIDPISGDIPGTNPTRLQSRSCKYQSQCIGALHSHKLSSSAGSSPGVPSFGNAIRAESGGLEAVVLRRQEAGQG